MMTLQKNIDFIKMAREHISLWEKWITIQHVKEAWFIEGCETSDYIFQKIKGNGYDHPFIILILRQTINAPFVAMKKLGLLF